MLAEHAVVAARERAEALSIEGQWRAQRQLPSAVPVAGPTAIGGDVLGRAGLVGADGAVGRGPEYPVHAADVVAVLGEAGLEDLDFCGVGRVLPQQVVD